MNALISATDLKTLVGNPDVIIIDASGNPGAKETYEKVHIAGALFVDLNKNLSDIKENPAEGGRHPLPSPSAFGELLGSLGISPVSHVIIYDHLGGGNAAARLWWMLRSIGHEKVQVVDGGFKALEAAGMDMNDETARPTASAAYPVNDYRWGITPFEQVQEISQQKNGVIIDVRESSRYAGEQEPIDLIAGHIPHAINRPFMNNLNEHGFFKTPDELQKLYQDITDDLNNGNVTVHCGSGVTACHTILAMDHAGLPLPNLYVGSWSEWSRNNLPMITQD